MRVVGRVDLVLVVRFESFGKVLPDIGHLERERLIRPSFSDDPVFCELLEQTESEESQPKRDVARVLQASAKFSPDSITRFSEDVPNVAEQESQKGPTQFNLLQIFITKAIYEFNGDQFKAGARPPKLNVNLTVGASIKLFAGMNGAFVELETKLIPDQEWQPYRIEVTISAAFQAQGGTTDELVTFCRVAAPSILFPYIRETAHRLTMDAPAGPVRLDPMNISMLLNQTEWTVAQVTDSDPNVPPQPSGQSASASPDSTTQP